jgi:Raf kinase inhibitor-like YbhB/YbcL family protein
VENLGSRPLTIWLMFSGVFAGAGSVMAQIPPARAPVLASSIAPANGGAKLSVTSGSFRNNGNIPDNFTQNGANQSPALSWSAGPAGTQSYVVLAEDSGVERPLPIDHWVLYDIPAATANLPQGLAKEPKLANPAGAMNGLNIAKAAGYIGPKPPAGQTHPYHFEVYALDTKLGLDPAKTDRTAVANAMKGHVLAEGEIVGLYTGK